MSEDQLARMSVGRKEVHEQQPKKDANANSANEKTRPSQVPKGAEKGGFDKEQAREIMRLLRDQEGQLKNLTKTVDKQSKEIANLEIYVGRVQKSSTATEKTLRETVTFIHNKGWKKKKTK